MAPSFQPVLLYDGCFWSLPQRMHASARSWFIASAWACPRHCLGNDFRLAAPPSCSN